MSKREPRSKFNVEKIDKALKWALIRFAVIVIAGGLLLTAICY